MRRVIFHDAGPRVTAAAHRLAADYDVRPLVGDATGAVVLVGPGSTAPPAAAFRIIGLVENGDAGPWPAT